jgi:hypothetical protein
VCAMSLGKEAELTDAHQAGGQHVEQEAAQELDRIEGHNFSAGVIGVVFPVETDAAIFERTQTVVGDGDAVCVAGPDTSAARGEARRKVV